MSMTRKKIKLSLNHDELATLLNILDTFSWQEDAVLKFAKIDTDKKYQALFDLHVRMQAIFDENFNESHIINRMNEGNLEFIHAQ